LCEKYLAITTLPNLREDLEVALSKADTTLSKIRSLTSGVFVPEWVVGLRRGDWGSRVFCLKVIESSLSSADIGQEIEIIV
jgi:hypothetical protein